MKTPYITLLVVMLHASLTQATIQFSHYTTDDGLPQYTIMDMLQDKKGFMWFATWDGLSRHDGFRFKNYKVRPSDHYSILSNRIQQLYEDTFGRIWFESYDGEIHCLNPVTETFWGPQLISELKSKNYRFTRIYIAPSGKVWLWTASDGAVVINDSLFNYTLFSVEQKNLVSNQINSVFEDSNGNSWILTNNGIQLFNREMTVSQNFFFNINDNSRHEKQSFWSAIELENDILLGAQMGQVWKYSKHTGKFQPFPTPAKSDIVSLLATGDHTYVLVTRDDGFLLYNQPTSRLEHFHTGNLPSLRTMALGATFTDKSGNFWFETRQESGIYRFNLKNKSLQYYVVAIEDVGAQLLPPFSFVIEDINGNIWVQPKGGGFSLYNKDKEILEPFYNDPGSAHWRFSNIVHSVYSDRQGNLWMCTRSHGLEKVVFSRNYFRKDIVNKGFNNVNANNVRAVFEDHQLRLWVATKDKRLTIYDKNRKLIGRLNGRGEIVPDALFPGMVYAIHQDKVGNLWIGSKGEGLFLLRPKTANNPQPLQQFVQEQNNPYSLSHNSVYSIFEDRNARIWIGTYGGGLNLIDKRNGEYVFLNHLNELKKYPFYNAARVRVINQHPQGPLYVGTTGGLLVFSSNFQQPEQINFRLFTREPGNASSLSSNDVHGICMTGKGDVFLATFGGGINKITHKNTSGFPEQFRAYARQSGLPSDVTLSVLEDEQGKLWISNEGNLSRFDPQTEQFETYAEIRAHLPKESFSEASTLRRHNNEMIFGTTNGLISFFPAEIINSHYSPKMVFTGFYLFNDEVIISNNSPLRAHIDDLKRLTLSYRQNFFSIEYAALDFINPENILFAYKLDGFDNDWIYAQRQRRANYTNLPHGTYTFRVKSTNSDGVWVDNEKAIEIVVKPSFWETSLAYVIYFVLLASFLFLLVKSLLTFYQMKNNILLEKKISELKLRFFTDISHEIRTPLTMITAPVDFLIKDQKTPEPIRKQLQLIAQNTGRLLRLVNQILDFRKIQFLHLKVCETELAALVEDICGNFTEIATLRKINFRFTDLSHHATVWIDPDCIDKMVMNLLSNAFKFTPEGRLVHVSVMSDDKHVSFEVRDEGSGIPKDKHRHLFTRFSTFNHDKNKPSTGIGLSLVKDLADKHGARISIESAEGRGTCVTIAFQKGISHFGKEVEIMVDKPTPEKNYSIAEQNETRSTTAIEAEQTENQQELPSILVIEDDHDLRSFIKTMLEGEYAILEAENGQEGLALAQKEIPDIIVSDVMMPSMDGIELLKEIKSNLNTSHIPVILLTSKTTIESKLEGLAYGADDYITKPFSVSYFKARISNLLSQRKHLQSIFRSDRKNIEAELNNPQPFIITSHDEILMKKVMETIEANMENFDFSVDDLREKAGMSRSAFFKKIKSLTGLAPVEFVRDVKLKRSAQLLSSGQYRVKEVTYMIGFSDSKYFAKCFKEKFGQTPMEFKQGKS